MDIFERKFYTFVSLMTRIRAKVNNESVESLLLLVFFFFGLEMNLISLNTNKYHEQNKIRQSPRIRAQVSHKFSSNKTYGQFKALIQCLIF
jgi:hypothetical protein